MMKKMHLLVLLLCFSIDYSVAMDAQRRRYSIVFTKGKTGLRICGEYTDDKQIKQVVAQCQDQMPGRACTLYVHRDGRTITRQIPPRIEE